MVNQSWATGLNKKKTSVNHAHLYLLHTNIAMIAKTPAVTMLSTMPSTVPMIIGFCSEKNTKSLKKSILQGVLNRLRSRFLE